MDEQESGNQDAERGNETEGNERNEGSVDVESETGEPGNFQMERLPSAANVSEGETNGVQIFPEKCRPLEPGRIQPRGAFACAAPRLFEPPRALIAV